jgi:hypothetical protein
MDALKRLPTGIQDFENLRRGDFCYVDKTALIYQLVHSENYCTLFRPRRFGKSLLLSTLKAYFEGKKKLFDGLAIAQLEKEWTAYPIFHLDLNLVTEGRPESLNDTLNYYLSEWEEQYGVTSKPNMSFGLRFSRVIRQAYEQTGRRVVILVDEYDKPITQTLKDLPLQRAYESTMYGFLGVVKSMDFYIKFALFTGVVKVRPSEMLSGDLNNLSDISMDKRYAGLCGFTDAELDGILAPYVARLSERQHLSLELARERIRSQYGGYRFCVDSEAVYNSFGMLLLLNKKEFRPYWTQSGSPDYLYGLLRAQQCSLPLMEQTPIDSYWLRHINPTAPSAIPMMYQTGYFTLKTYNQMFHMYYLGFPNQEVEQSFLSFLLLRYAHVRDTGVPDFVKAARDGRTIDFLKRLSRIFTEQSYEIEGNREDYYQNVVYLITKLLTPYLEADYKMSPGCIAIGLKTEEYIYLIACKVDGSADEALQQIEAGGYQCPFSVDGRKIVRIGLNFSSTTRGIERWVVKS